MNDPQAAPEKATPQDGQQDQHEQHKEQTHVQASAAVPTMGLIPWGPDDGVTCEGDTCVTSPPTA